MGRLFGFFSLSLSKNSLLISSRLMSSATRRSVTTSAPSVLKKVARRSAASTAETSPHFSARESTGWSCMLTTIREKESAAPDVFADRILMQESKDMNSFCNIDSSRTFPAAFRSASQ